MKDVSELGTILGVWAHPDDEAYLSAALMAAARRNDQRVYVVTETKAFAATWVSYLNRLNVFAPGTPPVTPDDEIAIKFEIPPDLLELKVQAVMAHDSQIGGMTSVFGDDWIRESQSGEYFRLADGMR